MTKEYPEIEATKKAKLEVEKMHHKFRMEEIKEEKEAKIESENLKFKHIMDAHRLKRADSRRQAWE